MGRSPARLFASSGGAIEAGKLTADGEFKAIGVLGSDVYDKLMILQALRKNFPRALFTTDLDSRLTHSSQLPLDAQSGRGFPFRALNWPRLQTPIPPFRDSYQTALFFRCCGLWRISVVDGTQELQPPGRQSFRRRACCVSMKSADMAPSISVLIRCISPVHRPAFIRRVRCRSCRRAGWFPSWRTILLLLTAVGLMFWCAILINSELWAMWRDAPG